MKNTENSDNQNIEALKRQINYANNSLINRFQELPKFKIKLYILLKEKLELKLKTLEAKQALFFND